MRFSRFGILSALVLAAAGCQADAGRGVGTVIPPLAFVRYVNAVPDSINMDSIRVTPRPLPSSISDTVFFSTTFTTIVRWVDQLEFTPQSFANVAFRGVGQGLYQGLEAGSRHFRIFTYDTKNASEASGLGTTTLQLADTTFDFAVGQYYTIVHVRSGGAGQNVRIYVDSLPPASATQVQYRAMNLAPTLGTLDVYATAAAADPIAGAPAAVGVAELARSAYITRPSLTAFAAQVTATTQTTSLAGAAAPAGVAGSTGSTGVDPIAGATIGGSVLTAMAFRASPAVVFYGRTFRAALAPTVTWVADRQPARVNP